MKRINYLLLSLIIFLDLAACDRNVTATIPAPTLITAASTAVPSVDFPQQLPAPEISSSLRFSRFGLESGLSQSVIHDILQDTTGYMWFATEDGLNRYDGYSITVFRPDPDDPNGLSDRWITSLYEDGQGYIWIGTRYGGINQYDPTTGQFIHFVNDPNNSYSPSSNYITALLEDHLGNLWIGTDQGLDRLDLDTNKFHHYYKDQFVGLSSNSISTIYQDSQNRLWIGTSDNGLNQYDFDTNTFKNYRYRSQDNNPVGKNQSNIISSNIRDIVEDNNRNLWIAAGDGLYFFNSQQELFTIYRHSSENQSSLLDNNIFSLLVDNDGLWIGTSKGLDYYIKETHKFIHFVHNPGNEQSISNGAVLSIYEGGGEILWIGTFGGSLNKLNPNQSKFTHYQANPTDPNSLSSNLISPIIVDNSGMVWIGTYGGGLNRFNPNTETMTHFSHDPDNPNSILSDEIYSLDLDSDGTLWVGTNLGLSSLAAGSNEFTHYTHDSTIKTSISRGTINAILNDSLGNLWLATSSGLDLYVPSVGVFIHHDHDPEQPNSISGNLVSALYEDREQNLWVGTFGGGLNQFDRETGVFIHYQNDPKDSNSLSHNSITALYQDTKGHLWIATAGGGLNLYLSVSDTFRRYTEKHGLPNNVVYGILEDEFGQLWLSTNYGISRFNPDTETFRNYTTSDGLQSTGFNPGAYAKTPDGRLYFGGINGMNAFYPSDITDNIYAPPIVLTSFTSDGILDTDLPQPQAIKELTVIWPNNSFSFEITSFSFTEPSKNQYAYLLEGFDDDWNYIGSNREGRYTNLPGGTFTLRFMGTNDEGLWHESNQTIQVTVVPPFWQTWLFRILTTLVILFFSMLFYQIRVQTIQRQNLQLEQTVMERTKALQERNEEIEALYSGDEKIIRSMTLDQIFQAIVEVAVKMLHADRSAVFVWSDKKEQIIPRVSDGFKDETLEILNFEKNEELVEKVFKTGDHLIIPDLDTKMLRPDLRAAIVDENIHSLVHLPIKVHDQIIGIFHVSFTRPNTITTDTVRLFNALVQRAALSAENMQLFEQTKELAVIEERNRVARDLHDSAKQKAFAALAQLGAANGILKTNPESVWTHLGEAENLVYEVIQELTFLIQEMYPMALKEKGLARTLREYVFEWENRNGVMINLLIKNPKRMPLETEQAIYRIIQESLANVARHSQADQVEVSLLYNSEAVSVQVVDNGKGFDADKSSGMGLRTIRERVESIGGFSRIQSKPGQGTKVHITAPYNGQQT